jgi:hypothetical protein
VKDVLAAAEQGNKADTVKVTDADAGTSTDAGTDASTAAGTHAGTDVAVDPPGFVPIRKNEPLAADEHKEHRDGEERKKNNLLDVEGTRR